MLSVRAVILLVALSACGRFGFTEREANDVDSPDASIEEAADAQALDPDAMALSSCSGLDAPHLCDGFEDGDLSAWATETSGGTLELVASPVFRGNAALRANTSVAGGVASVRMPHDTQTSGTLYMRSYWYLPSALATPGLVEVTSTGDDSNVHTHFGFDGDIPVLLVNNDTTSSSMAIPRDTWACIEVDVIIGTTGGGVLRVNGTEVATQMGVDTTLATGYDGAAFGAYYTAGAAGAFEIYIDEIAVSDQPIGCL